MTLVLFIKTTKALSSLVNRNKSRPSSRIPKNNRVTGGSWKKSPKVITCSPPKGRLAPLTVRPIKSRALKSEASSMEISSITNVFAARQRAQASQFFDTVSARASGVPFPSPIPAQE